MIKIRSKLIFLVIILCGLLCLSSVSATEDNNTLNNGGAIIFDPTPISNERVYNIYVMDGSEYISGAEVTIESIQMRFNGTDFITETTTTQGVTDSNGYVSFYAPFLAKNTFNVHFPDSTVVSSVIPYSNYVTIYHNGTINTINPNSLLASFKSLNQVNNDDPTYNSSLNPDDTTSDINTVGSDSSSHAIKMQKTGLPIIALLLVVFTIPLGFRKKQ